MTPWLRDVITEHLVLHCGVKYHKAQDLTDSLLATLADRHFVISSSFLTDEQYAEQKKIQNDVEYTKQNQLYRAALSVFAEKTVDM